MEYAGMTEGERLTAGGLHQLPGSALPHRVEDCRPDRCGEDPKDYIGPIAIPAPTKHWPEIGPDVELATRRVQLAKYNGRLIVRDADAFALQFRDLGSAVSWAVGSGVVDRTFIVTPARTLSLNVTVLVRLEI